MIRYGRPVEAVSADSRRWFLLEEMVVVGIQHRIRLGEQQGLLVHHGHQHIDVLDDISDQGLEEHHLRAAEVPLQDGGQLLLGEVVDLGEVVGGEAGAAAIAEDVAALQQQGRAEDGLTLDLSQARGQRVVVDAVDVVAPVDGGQLIADEDRQGTEVADPDGVDVGVGVDVQPARGDAPRGQDPPQQPPILGVEEVDVQRGVAPSGADDGGVEVVVVVPAGVDQPELGDRLIVARHADRRPRRRGVAERHRIPGPHPRQGVRDQIIVQL